MNNTHSQTPIHLSPLLVPKLSIILDQELNEESISVDVSTACEMEMNCWEEEVRKRSRVIYKGDDELSMEGKQSEVSTSIGEIELPGKRKSSFGDPPSSPIPQKLRLLSVSPSTIMLQRVIPASKLPKNKNQRTLIYPPRSSSLFTTPGRGTLAMHKRTPKKCSTKGMFDLNNVVISSHSKCKIQTKDWSSQQNILTPGYKILPFDYYWLGKSQEDGSLDLSPRVLEESREVERVHKAFEINEILSRIAPELAKEQQRKYREKRIERVVNPEDIMKIRICTQGEELTLLQ